MIKTEIFEKNIRAWEKFFPASRETIEKIADNNKEEIEVIAEEAYDGEVIFKIKHKDRILYLNEKRNHKEHASVWVQSLGTFNRGSMVMMCGLGNADYLRELIDKTDKSVRIIIYEPSFEIFINIMTKIDISDILKNRMIVFVIKGMNDNDLVPVLAKYLQVETFDDVVRFIHPNYRELFLKDIKNFYSEMQKIVSEEMVNINTREKFAKVVVDNFFNNVKYVADGYKSRQLADVIPRNIPAIVVAAGPSLNKNINEIKKAKNKAFIIAVDTALKPLLNAGIVPDMFTLVDGMKPIELVKVEGSENIPLLTSIDASQEIFKYHKGKKIFYDEGFEYIMRLFVMNGIFLETVATGGSVATLAFAIAYMIGIDRIILVGQDLAFTGNKTHADGTFKAKMDEVDTKNAIMVEGNYEEKVPTRSDMKLYLDWYNSYIEGCMEHRPAFHVINATEGGAKIKNTEVMTLHDAIERECKEEVNIEECFNNLKPVFNPQQREKIINFFHETPKLFDDYINAAQKTKKLYDRLDRLAKSGSAKKKLYLSLLKSIKKEIKQLETSVVNQFIYTTLTKADFILKGEQYLEEDSFEAEAKEIARKGTKYMDLLIQCAELFKEISLETVAKVE